MTFYFPFHTQQRWGSVCFTTNISAAGTFDPAVIGNDTGESYWDLDSHSIQQGSSASLSFGYAGNKEVCYRFKDLNSDDAFYDIEFNNDNMFGVIDFSDMTDKVRTLNVSRNDDMTNFVVQSSNASYQQINCEFCDGLTVIDLGWITSALGTQNIRFCPNITSITNMPSGGNASAWNSDGCTSLTTLDLSNDFFRTTGTVDWLIGNQTVANPITFGTHTGINVRQFIAGNCKAATALDLSGVGKIECINTGTFNNWESCTSLTWGADVKFLNNLNMSRWNSYAFPLDLSTIEIGGTINLRFSAYTDIIWPLMPDPVTGFTLSGLTGLTGVLDLSNSTDFSGRLDIDTCTGLTSIIWPTITGPTTLITVFGSNSLTTLDFSGFGNNFAGSIDLATGNTPGTVITPPSSSNGVITFFRVDDTAYGNQGLAWMVGANDGIDLRMSSLNLTATDVNSYLDELDNKGWINGSLNITGINAAPDTTSGGIDGVAAAANLVTKGWTVLTN